MIILNNDQFAEKLNITTESFLKNNSYYIKKYSENGYFVKKIGKGKKAIYEIQKDNKNKKLHIKEYINNIFGIDPKHPLIFYKYLYFIKTNDISYLSDADIAIKLGYTKNSRKEILKCRKQLMACGYLSIDEDSIGYFLISYEENGKREKKRIGIYLFAEILSKADELKNNGCDDVWGEIQKEFGGYPSRVYKRIKTEKLKNKLNSNGYSEMLSTLNIKWRKKDV